MFQRIVQASEERADKQGLVRIEIRPPALPLLNLHALGRFLGSDHHRLALSGAELKDDPRVLQALMDQLKQYLTAQDLAAFRTKITKGNDIVIDEMLLPPFARQKVGTYNLYQGPNCFHASLAFQSSKFVRSPQINVKRERGYHDDMINYDELWRVLNRSFYEVDPKVDALRYGDIVVFFDLPDHTTNWVDFRTIRHALTYLFDSYTFSKGSKSPDSPYSVKTLQEEWETWKRYARSWG